MPVFGPVAIRKMFNEQLEIASQMILRWDRLGPDHPIICSDDFTRYIIHPSLSSCRVDIGRLAFDTIGICAFNYRFNNFYAEKVHPFVTQMAESLLESGKRGNRTKLETGLRYFSQQTYQQNINAMHQLCDEIVEERIRNPQPEIDDLLNTMINVADPVTGEKLSKENIRYQMVTFLVSGTKRMVAPLPTDWSRLPATKQRAGPCHSCFTIFSTILKPTTRHKRKSTTSLETLPSPSNICLSSNMLTPASRRPCVSEAPSPPFPDTQKSRRSWRANTDSNLSRPFTVTSMASIMILRSGAATLMCLSPRGCWNLTNIPPERGGHSGRASGPALVVPLLSKKCSSMSH